MKYQKSELPSDSVKWSSPNKPVKYRKYTGETNTGACPNCGTVGDNFRYYNEYLIIRDGVGRGPVHKDGLECSVCFQPVPDDDFGIKYSFCGSCRLGGLGCFHFIQE